jgi:signal transduction histidine kinase/CheY-like chemotaxis protein
MRHKNGSWRTLESRASTIVKSGKVEKLVIVNRDVTERKHLEEQFRQSQKMEAVGRLSGGVAHDFNNLLGVIIGYGEIVRDGTATESPLRTCVEEMLKAGHRAATLTRQLLAFSRQQVLDPKVLELNVVVKDMEKMLLRLIGEDVRLKTSLDPALVRIKADQGQIEQVVMNLAVNARDAMPRGGELRIETSNFHMDEAFVRRYPYPVLVGDYVLLSVTDNGVGMDATTRARVFEPFFTTKEKGKGTGLGLSTVYGVVKQSGGYIDVISEPGAGASFKIYLPKVEVAADPQKQSTDLPVSLQGMETVLLVEDETSLRELSRHLLELCGYSVLEAENGEEALKKSQGHRGVIHLLLTDVVMPGMSGRILADQLVRHRPETRVVYMSGYTGQTVGEHGVLAEGSFFLPKPFTRDALARKVREALDVSIEPAGIV